MRVLIVDDEADTADMLQMLLRAAGHEAKVAYRGREAIEVAMSFEPELAVVDIHLPDMSGVAVAKEIRKASRRRVSIVGISGRDFRGLPLTASFDQHAVKPVSAALLYQLIDAAQEARHAASIAVF